MITIQNDLCLSRYAKEQDIEYLVEFTEEKSAKNFTERPQFQKLDRAERQRLYISKAIKDGIAASNKRSGRKLGQFDKLTPELKADIQAYLHDRSIKQVDLMKKYGISRNTLKKYIESEQKH
ncbi:hypothetical protein NXH64_13910 [Butyrivibrio fibrisolvens]|uniref:helix-turn-helix domain-containing protein n=1 Tax=Pseudobutyrivibrio ruminis TaxID=46206 RepID=UPI0012DBFD1F|nr:helix-turn-helix domain-containing protein [Pseudobutyrivibrio ruminis]MDC7280594.1 hypothetical protein [Butyrivibrio fibrisolvens]